MNPEYERKYLYDAVFHHLVDSITQSDFSAHEIRNAVELALYLRDVRAEKLSHPLFRPQLGIK